MKRNPHKIHDEFCVPVSAVMLGVVSLALLGFVRCPIPVVSPGTDTDMKEVKTGETWLSTESVEQKQDGTNPGNVGEPCKHDSDCAEGACITGRNGNICSQLCSDECPDRYVCADLPWRGTGKVCIPIDLWLCMPCTANADCRPVKPYVENFCIPFGDHGSFCGSSCADTFDCPAGFKCQLVQLKQGQAYQCVPEGGLCSCSYFAIEHAAWTTCFASNHLGACKGERFCQEDGSLSPCNAPEPVQEICDGKDQDCDGQTDEDLPKTECGQGVCKHTVESCVDGKPTLCDPFEGAAPEVCNGLDDDCDGSTDEDLGSITCGTGACLTTVPACVDGQLQECIPAPPSEEVCDGIDNNCDGETDEGFGTIECGLGVCHHTVEVCMNGMLVECDPFLGAQEEECNLLDDDCDGETDEDMGEIACGVGQCKSVVPACIDGQIPQCVPGQPEDEVCDGKDNDCDGDIDEDFGAIQCGVGICQHTVETCVNGVPQECDPMKGSQEEVCNLLDDDCDGETDEDLGQISCGIGACQTLLPACIDGKVPVCTPGSPSPEKCDGLDNNCNGITDEGFGYTSCGTGACLHTSPNCQNGQMIECDPTEGSSSELCDGIDNDCDGITDEDCTCHRLALQIVNPCWEYNAGFQVEIELHQQDIDWTAVSDDLTNIELYDRLGNKLPYWVQEFVQTDDDTFIRIWTKVSKIDKHTSDIIYMHYGAEVQGYEQQPDQVFVFFDDFADALWQDKWQPSTDMVQSIEEDGVLKVKSKKSDDYGVMVAKLFSFDTSNYQYAIFYRSRRIDTICEGHGVFLFHTDEYPNPDLGSNVKTLNSPLSGLRFLAGNGINCYGITGLEVSQYKNDQWNILQELKLDNYSDNVWHVYQVYHKKVNGQWWMRFSIEDLPNSPAIELQTEAQQGNLLSVTSYDDDSYGEFDYIAVRIHCGDSPVALPLEDINACE